MSITLGNKAREKKQCTWLEGTQVILAYVMHCTHQLCSMMTPNTKPLVTSVKTLDLVQETSHPGAMNK